MTAIERRSQPKARRKTPSVGRPSGLFSNHKRSTEGIEELTGFEFSLKEEGNFSVHAAGGETETATRFRATKDVTFLRRSMNDWHSYYLEEPPVDRGAYRALARQAGVHLYVETNDVLYCQCVARRASRCRCW